MSWTSFVVLIEGVLVFGGVLAFAWWQIRSVRRTDADEEETPSPPPAAAPLDGRTENGVLYVTPEQRLRAAAEAEAAARRAR